MQSDEDLLELVRQRDEAAFETLFARYEAMVRRHLARTVRNDDAAEDLTQEVFLRVWTRAEQWDGRGAFRAWLFRIATNLALNQLRSVQRRREQPFAVADGSSPDWMEDSSSLDPEAALETAARYEQLRRLVDELSEEKRDVVRLIHEAEMKASEAAEALGIPEGTVKSRLHYAMKHLAREWKDMETEE